MLSVKTVIELLLSPTISCSLIFWGNWACLASESSQDLKSCLPTNPSLRKHRIINKKSTLQLSSVLPIKRLGYQPKWWLKSLKSKRKPCLWGRFPSRNGGFRSLWIKTVILNLCSFQVNLAEQRKAYTTGILFSLGKCKHLAMFFEVGSREPTWTKSTGRSRR